MTLKTRVRKIEHEYRALIDAENNKGKISCIEDALEALDSDRPFVLTDEFAKALNEVVNL